MNIEELPTEFKKFGDQFTQIGYNEVTGMYLYKRVRPTGMTYYEVFKRRIGNVYRQVDKPCVLYPTNEAFGIWAWCSSYLGRTMKYYNAENLR